MHCLLFKGRISFSSLSEGSLGGSDPGKGLRPLENTSDCALEFELRPPGRESSRPKSGFAASSGALTRLALLALVWVRPAVTLTTTHRAA